MEIRPTVGTDCRTASRTFDSGVLHDAGSHTVWSGRSSDAGPTVVESAEHGTLNHRVHGLRILRVSNALAAGLALTRSRFLGSHVIFSPGAHGDVTQQADDVAAHRILDIRDRRLAGLDGLNEVGRVIRAHLQTLVSRFHRLGRTLRIVGRIAGAVEIESTRDLDPALVANELGAVSAGPEDQLDVAHGDGHVPVVDAVVETFRRDHAVAFHGDQSREIRIAAPHHDVQRMRAPSSQVADRLAVDEVRSGRLAEIVRVRAQRRRPAPHIEVKTLGNRRFSRGAAGSAVRRIDFDRMDLADHAAAHEFTADPAMRHAALLRAVLENDSLLLDHFLQGQILFDGHPQRLLDVNVLAGSRRQNPDGNVPMIGRGNHNGVDIVAGQQFAKVAIGFPFADGSDGISLVLVAVRGRHALKVRHRLGVVENILPATAHANVPDRDPLVGRGFVFQPQSAPGNKQGCRHGTGSHTLQYITPTEFSLECHQTCSLVSV